MSEPSSSVLLGARLRRARRARGLSLDVVAGLAGISKPYLSRLERGERRLDSLQLLDYLARALDVPVEHLTTSTRDTRTPTGNGAGHRPPAARTVTAVQDAALAGAALAKLRAAVLTATPDPDHSGDTAASAEANDEGAQSAAYLREQLALLTVAVRSCDLVGQSRLLPDLLAAARAATAVGRRDGWVALGWSYLATSMLVRGLGAPDLALLVADRLRQTADHLHTPVWSSLARYTTAHAMTPLGAPAAALTLVRSHANVDDFRHATAGDRADARIARGACLLIAAYATALTHDHQGAVALLDEAEILAARDQGYWSMAREFTGFTPWNVLMHRVAVEVEAGDPATAVALAATLDPRAVPAAERLSYFYVDVARAHTRLGDATAATAAFLRAERAAPLRTRLSPTVHDTIRHLLDGPSHPSNARLLRQLAVRCAVNV